MKYFGTKFLKNLAGGDISDRKHKKFKKWLFTVNHETREQWLEAFATVHDNEYNDPHYQEGYFRRKRQNNVLWTAVAVILLAFSFIFYFKTVSVNNYEQQYYAANDTDHILLKDSTEIKLHKNSNIQVLFTDSTRQIILEGEAFFNVRKDVDRPMLVKTEAVETTVTGTEFRIKQSEKGIQIVLIEGEVSVAYNQKSSLLKPSQQWIWNRSTDQELITNVRDSNGDYVRFENERLSKILVFLEWKYDVEFSYQPEEIEDCLISISIGDVSIDQAFKLISFVSNVCFEANESKQYVISEKCK